MSTMPRVRFKRTASVVLPVVYEDSSQPPVPVDLTTYTITAQLRSSGDGSLAASGVVVKGDQGTDPGTFTITFDVTALDAGEYVTDIVFSDALVVVTETIAVQLLDGVTQP